MVSRSLPGLIGITGLLTILSAPGKTQTCMPLRGQWRLDTGQSRLAAGLSFNPFYHVDQVRLVMSQTAGGAISQSWQFDGAHIHDAIKYAFTVDGHAQSTGAHSVLDSVPADIVPAWQNCTLIIDARSSLFGTDVWTHNIYVLDAAGRHLSILQTGRSRIGHTERTLVFDRTGEAP